MKHCSSGREKLFCRPPPGSGKWWCWGTLRRTECFRSPYCQLLVLRKVPDSNPTHATICFMIPGKS